MNGEDKTKDQLLGEIGALRSQVEHLSQGNQRALLALEERSAELEALNTIGQVTALGADLSSIFRVIHEETEKLVGSVDFMIALYDEGTKQIEVPYAFEDDHYLQIEPFPLGEGLTSIVIRTRQPIIMVQDTVYKARELEAKTAGAPAKSWLGVPLIFAGEVIGAIIVQDAEKENRFSKDDQRLLSTLANQVAVSIRYVSILEDTRKQADHERIVSEISGKVWASASVDTILRTAIRELCQAWNASEGWIVLDFPHELPTDLSDGD